MLKEFIEEYRDPALGRLANPEVHQAVKDACFRSIGDRRIYAWRDVAMDYLPCLSALDRTFKNRPKPNRRALHPFDMVDKKSGRMIDPSGK